MTAGTRRVRPGQLAKSAWTTATVLAMIRWQKLIARLYFLIC
jgi:hypothetical protein